MRARHNFLIDLQHANYSRIKHYTQHVTAVASLTTETEYFPKVTQTHPQDLVCHLSDDRGMYQHFFIQLEHVSVWGVVAHW